MNEPEKKIKILILNTDHADAMHIQQELLKQDFSVDLQFAKKEQEFVKKVLRFEPDVVIASNQVRGYSGIEVYKDVKLALPHVFFILTDAEHISIDMQDYVLTGIDCFLMKGNYTLLSLIVLQGYNKKHLEKIQHTSHEMLLERKMRLRAVFNNNQNAIFILGLKGEIIDLNPMGVTLMETPFDKILGADFARFISREDVKKFRTAFSSAFRGRECSDEFGFTISRRSRKQSVINLVPIRNEERHITSLMIICKDVTEVFLLRKKFKLSEERFLALANHAPVGIYYENADGNRLFVNNVWCQFTGLSFKESLGMGWTKAIHPEDRERIGKSISARRINNGPVADEYRITDRDGNVKWMRSRSSPYIDENGKLQGYVGMVSDITKEKLQTLELVQAHNRQQISMQLAGLGVAERDLVNLSGTWSDEVFDIFELDKSQKVISIEDSIEKYLHPDDREQGLSILRKAFEDVGTQRASFRIITNSGKTKYLRSISVIEKNLEEKPIKLVSAIQDITKDWEREQQLKENEERLLYLFNHSPDAIYIEDLDGNILEANVEACNVQGLSREDLIGKNIADIAPPELHEELFTNFKKMAKQEIFALKSFSWNKDGSKIPVQIKQRLIQYNGNPALLLHVRKVEEFELQK